MIKNNAVRSLNDLLQIITTRCKVFWKQRVDKNNKQWINCHSLNDMKNKQTIYSNEL